MLWTVEILAQYNVFASLNTWNQILAAIIWVNVFCVLFFTESHLWSYLVWNPSFTFFGQIFIMLLSKPVFCGKSTWLCCLWDCFDAESSWLEEIIKMLLMYILLCFLKVSQLCYLKNSTVEPQLSDSIFSSSAFTKLVSCHRKLLGKRSSWQT